jgi:glycosyltransferase involved in cell wall biosynthesis
VCDVNDSMASLRERQIQGRPTGGQEPTVSVVVPTFRRADLLDHTLMSIRNQVFRDIEVIVCDDVADAATENVLERHITADVRVCHLRNDRILPHQAGTILLGLRNARGAFVAICEDDNTWQPSLLSQFVDVLFAHPSVVAVFSDHWVIDRDGTVDIQSTETNTRRWKRDILTPGLHQPFIRVGLVWQSLAMTTTTLLRRSALDLSDFPEEIGPSVDRWLTYLVCRNGWPAWYVPERLGSYRAHRDSITSSGGSAWARSAVYLWQRLLEDDRLSGIRPELRTMSAIALTQLGITLIREGRGADARRFLGRAVVRKPALRSTAAFILSMLPQKVSAKM